MAVIGTGNDKPLRRKNLSANASGSFVALTFLPAGTIVPRVRFADFAVAWADVG